MKKMLLLLLLCPALLPAWGRQGTETVALVAQGLLRPQARNMVNWLRHDPAWRKLEPGHGRRYRAADRRLYHFCHDKTLDLGLAAGWAATWEKRHPDTIRLHDVKTPLSSDGDVEALKQACGGDCILTELRTRIRLLNDTGAKRLARLQALLWVTGLMADLHQPLRCADNLDQGGSQRMVRVRGRRETLRYAWDTGFLKERRIRPKTLARQLLADEKRRPWDLEAVDERSPWVWATETFWVAKNTVYPQVRDDHGHYNKAEIAKAWPVVRMQLTRGGVRLAEVLNAAAAR
ncbi:MAG: S1/P1 nuclease [bacterium]